MQGERFFEGNGGNYLYDVFTVNIYIFSRDNDGASDITQKSRQRPGVAKTGIRRQEVYPSFFLQFAQGGKGNFIYLDIKRSRVGLEIKLFSALFLDPV